MENLIEACNNSLYNYTGGDSSVKRRQIFDDIKFMESSQGWNISLAKLKEGRKVFYRYDDKEFSINNNLLNEREELQLREALNTISRFKGMPQFTWIDELSAKLEQGLKLGNRKDVIIEFEQNQYLKGLEYITPIYEAIQNMMNLEIDYQSFKQEEPLQITLSPYFLKQYNNRWFLFGISAGHENLTNLALDRIVSIISINESYIENKSIDFEEYFDDIIGVTVNNNKVQEIKLKIQNELWPYVKNKPIHGSQKRIKKEEIDDGYKIVQLKLSINYELKSLIFSHMDSIEVLSPKDLRDDIGGIAKKIKIKYN